MIIVKKKKTEVPEEDGQGESKETKTGIPAAAETKPPTKTNSTAAAAAQPVSNGLLGLGAYGSDSDSEWTIINRVSFLWILWSREGIVHRSYYIYQLIHRRSQNSISHSIYDLFLYHFCCIFWTEKDWKNNEIENGRKYQISPSLAHSLREVACIDLILPPSQFNTQLYYVFDESFWNAEVANKIFDQFELVSWLIQADSRGRRGGGFTIWEKPACVHCKRRERGREEALQENKLNVNAVSVWREGNERWRSC